MNALAFILRRSLKNRIIEMAHKPAQLVIVVVIVAAIIGLIILSGFTRTTVETTLDWVWLKGIAFAFLALYYVMAVINGTKNGSAIFSMADVNLAFVSPLRPQAILLYGVVRTAAAAVLGSLFVLFQGNSLGMWWGTDFGDLLILFAGFILTVTLTQIVSLAIYSLTNGNPRRKLIVRLIAAALFVPMLVVFVVAFTSNGQLYSP